MRRHIRWVAIAFAFALVAAACGSGDGDDTTTTTTAPPPPAATTTTAPAPPSPTFVGTSLDSGVGCGGELGYNDAEGNPATYGGKIDSVTATDEFTVQFNLCSPDPAFLAKLAFSVFGIQPEEHLAAMGGAPLRNPVGTGAYSLVEWVAGDSVVYARNDDYYGPKAAHSTAVLRWATEGAQRLLELQSGNVDGITFPSTDDYSVIESDPNTTLVPKIEANILYVAMTNTFAPFDNPEIRRALAVGIDRQRIVDQFYPPGSEVASHFTPCSVQGGCEGDAWYDYDPDLARQLIADNGGGFSTTIFYRDVFRGYLPEPGAVAVELQAQLDDLGIDASIEVQESGTFIANSQAGLLDGIYLLGWTGDYPHITNFLDFHFTANNPQFGDPDSSYTDPLLAASKLASFAEAQPFYVTANNALKDFVPMVPIVHSATAFAFGSDVTGAYAPPWGQVLFHLMDDADGDDTFVFMQGNEPISLYCADESDGESLRACNQVVEALYGYAPNGDPIPQLATDCSPNAALDQWTCTLRTGVLFHDGSSLDANDVVASFSAGLNAADPLHVGNTGAWTYYDYLWDGLINPPEPAG